MPTSLRLNGDRDRAAQWWGEGKRILFQLKTNLGYLGVNSGWRSRTMTDGTMIRVGSIYDADVIEINSPFVSIQAVTPEELLFILCYRGYRNHVEGATTFKIYQLSPDDLEITEIEMDISEVDILDPPDVSGAPAVGILTNDEANEHVIFGSVDIIYPGPTTGFEDWLKCWGTVYVPANPRAVVLHYPYRYVYTMPGYDGIPGLLPYRMIDHFGLDRLVYFYRLWTYYPKLETGTVTWTVANHPDIYAEEPGVPSWTYTKGKKSFTLDATKAFAVSWDEKTKVQAEAPFSFLHMPGSITDPFTRFPYPPTPAPFDYDSLGYIGPYTWPIVGTLNSRKVPKIYALDYIDDDGPQSIPNYLTDTLSYSDIGDGDTRTTSGTCLSHWILATIGDKKALYFKNLLQLAGTETGRSAWGDWGSAYDGWDGYINGNFSETLSQEFYAGDVLLEGPLASSVVFVKTGTEEITHDPVDPLITTWYRRTLQCQLDATFRWMELLDYDNHEGNLICFYKKIEQTLDFDCAREVIWFLNASGETTWAWTSASTRKVEYWMLLKTGAVITKKLLATLNITHSASLDYHDHSVYVDGAWVYLNDPTYTTQHLATGQRLYGVTCQLNSDYGVFSYNLDTIKADLTAGDYYGCFFYNYPGTVNYYRLLTFFRKLAYPIPLPYPFPLEDMNYIWGTSTYAWNGKFHVGAVDVEVPSEIVTQEMEDQTDFTNIAATGLVKKSQS